MRTLGYRSYKLVDSVNTLKLKTKET